MKVGEVGASGLQREALRVSKIDNSLRLEYMRVTSSNPLSTVECGVNVFWIDNKMPREPGKPLGLDQTEIGEAICALFSTKQLNRGEKFAVAIRDGQVVLAVSINSFDALDHASTLNYGIVDENTIFRFKVGEKSRSAIKVNSSEAKQLFKENMSF